MKNVEDTRDVIASTRRDAIRAEFALQEFVKPLLKLLRTFEDPDDKEELLKNARLIEKDLKRIVVTYDDWQLWQAAQAIRRPVSATQG